MKKLMQYILILFPLVSCEIIKGSGKVPAFTAAIRANNYDAVKQTFNALKNKPTDKASKVMKRLKGAHYYSVRNKAKQGADGSHKFNSPIRQAVVGAGQGKPWINSLRALKDSGVDLSSEKDAQAILRKAGW